MILLALDEKSGENRSAWLDSWHMARQVMTCECETNDEMATLSGSYAAPPGPDWGWRIEVDLRDPEHLTLRMFNVPPAGDEVIAVVLRGARAPEAGDR